jgi:hypothetical protein
MGREAGMGVEAGRVRKTKVWGERVVVRVRRRVGREVSPGLGLGGGAWDGGGADVGGGAVAFVGVVGAVTAGVEGGDVMVRRVGGFNRGHRVVMSCGSEDR